MGSALVRFINEYNRPSAVHLHGSYSRAPFDGWAEDMINPGQYKVCMSLCIECVQLTFLGLLFPQPSRGANHVVS